MGKTGVTINDIAHRAGVSKVTVSYILNGKETRVRISDATRQRVLSIARETGYRPNALARSLARRRTDTLMLAMQSPHIFRDWSAFLSEMMHGVMAQANTLDYDVILHTKGATDSTQDRLALTDGRADGALLLRDGSDTLGEQLAAADFPVVQIFSTPSSASVLSVDCDNVAGGRQAVEHLIALGHRRIGFVGGAPGSSAVADRHAGYCAALEAHQIPANPAWHFTISYAGGDFSDLLSVMRAPERRPTALFFWSDDVALRAIAVLREALNLQIPRDVSVIGFDGTQLAEQTTPRLTTIRQPIARMAAHGVEMLVNRIRGAPICAPRTLFSPELVARDSCAPLLS